MDYWNIMEISHLDDSLVERSMLSFGLQLAATVLQSQTVSKNVIDGAISALHSRGQQSSRADSEKTQKLFSSL